VVLSSSAERSFCVGADLKERAGFSDEDLLRQRPLFRRAFAGVLDLPVPAVAAVAGFALGGGLELALSCDLVVADETAVLGLPEVTVGLCPAAAAPQLLVRGSGAPALPTWC
jgi:enoyl-CoA hydratase/carnithine racemase